MLLPLRSFTFEKKNKVNYQLFVLLAKTLRKDIEMETLFEMGMIYQDLGMLDWAKTAFEKFIDLAKREGFIKRVCDGFLELAICYRW